MLHEIPQDWNGDLIGLFWDIIEHRGSTVQHIDYTNHICLSDFEPYQLTLFFKQIGSNQLLYHFCRGCVSTMPVFSTAWCTRWYDTVLYHFNCNKLHFSILTSSSAANKLCFSLRFNLRFNFRRCNLLENYFVRIQGAEKLAELCLP
jgi:hypothetical protein